MKTTTASPAKWNVWKAVAVLARQQNDRAWLAIALPRALLAARKA